MRISDVVRTRNYPHPYPSKIGSHSNNVEKIGGGYNFVLLIRGHKSLGIHASDFIAAETLDWPVRRLYETAYSPREYCRNISGACMCFIAFCRLLESTMHPVINRPAVDTRPLISKIRVCENSAKPKERIVFFSRATAISIIDEFDG